jgi:hypothetical protein
MDTSPSSQAIGSSTDKKDWIFLKEGIKNNFKDRVTL